MFFFASDTVNSGPRTGMVLGLAPSSVRVTSEDPGTFDISAGMPKTAYRKPLKIAKGVAV